MVCTCFIDGCHSRGSKFKFFTVPYLKDSQMVEWLKACPKLMKYNYSQYQNLRICSLHFIPDQIITKYGRQRLAADAVPTKNLPDSPETTSQHIMEHSCNILLEIEPDISSNIAIDCPSPEKSISDLQSDIPSQSPVSTCTLVQNIELVPPSPSSSTSAHSPRNENSLQYDMPSTNQNSAIEVSHPIKTSPVNLKSYNYSQCSDPARCAPWKPKLVNDNRILKRKLRLLKKRFNKLIVNYNNLREIRKST